MFSKILIANRGAIACRIIRTLSKMGVASVAVYSEADASSSHVAMADEAVLIGPPPASESYLKFQNIFDAARKTGAQAIHPGYGFLSENAEFAEACAKEGLVFIGPTPEQMRRFGLKHTAREIAIAQRIPLLPGSGLLDDLVQAQTEVTRIGFPVMLKSTAGGGGIGMRLCRSEAELVDAYDSVRRLSESAFKQNGVYLEKYLEVARHIEVQIFGDGKGKVVALGERDCSAQRRNQKVIEETPASGLGADVRAELLKAAVDLTSAIGYQSAGTVEFVYDVGAERFYFLEVNTRLQVEHGITEEVTGVDLVEWMVRTAAGETAHVAAYKHAPKGASIQVRLYAEDPYKNFQPSSGQLTQAEFPPDARVETWVTRGSVIPPFYDPMIAKVIVKAGSRAEAVRAMSAALADTRIAGIECNLAYLRQVIASPVFGSALVHTKTLSSFDYRPLTIDVIEPGTQTSVQDYPGRTGYWNIGVPPSGPMDDLSFRLANELVGNDPADAGLEITLSGPTLKFNTATTIALAGASFGAELNGIPLPLWKSVPVKPGSILKMATVGTAGCRAYLAVKGGLQVPDYLGSKATFSLGKFGGHAGRILRHGDVLALSTMTGEPTGHRLVEPELIPLYGNRWEIRVLYGPHAAPDFFAEGYVDEFFSSDFKVHYNSNRLGIRLIGPKPTWSRTDGGEAGLHPSNIHDNEYAVGTINFTGDMPVILAKDGPSLGGFVCPATIIKAELWKMGQLRPGDAIRFKKVGYDEAFAAELDQDAAIKSLATVIPLTPVPSIAPLPDNGAVLYRSEAKGASPGMTIRQAGDRNVLIEYGPLLLDLNLRFRVHSLMEYLRKAKIGGLLELSPGVRSLQINFDGRKLPLKRLVDALAQAETELPPVESLVLPTRIVRLPLAFDASSTKAAIEKYQQSVRQTAPWLPSNVEFIRRINGLDSIDQVSRTIFDASYLVLGLGDVYLGAPCAVPLDPRHRLVTTKYNPARTWTAEGEVGIGGVYMCVYGMESPGGYQLVGRTVPVWNTYKQTKEFEPGSPWLLRFFDQVRFFPMCEKDVLEFREAFLRGQVGLDIKEETFSVSDYQAYLRKENSSITAFKTKQQIAFEEERERWKLSGSIALAEEPPKEEPPEQLIAPPNGRLVTAPITGSVWAVPAKIGDAVAAGQKLIVIEAMKMEVGVDSPIKGRLEKIVVTPGTLVSAGQPIAIVVEDLS